MPISRCCNLAGVFGVFRIHQRTIVSFQKRRPTCRRSRAKKGRPSQGPAQVALGEVIGPTRPDRGILQASTSGQSGSPSEEYARLPESLLVRELRYRVTQRGFRVREVTLATTLLDAERYPAAELAKLYLKRWEIETNLRHLKQTLHMDVLRTKTVDGIHKELAMFAIVYNLVRLVMLRAAKRQNVAVDPDQLHRRPATTVPRPDSVRPVALSMFCPTGRTASSHASANDDRKSTT